ncbi:MAG: hypothetical protein ACRDH5_05910, partial [bacterium]
MLFTLFTLVCFTGCTTLQPLPDAQPATIQQSVRPGSIVEIERVDGTRTVLKVESVGAEAIEGTESGQRLRIPLGEIRSIGTQTVAKSATLWT